MDNKQKLSIFDLEKSGVAEVVKSWGEPAFRADQIWQGIYQNLWSSPEDFTNLSLKLREKISDDFDLSPIKPIAEMKSKDGETIKTLFSLQDGGAIEAVLMMYNRRRTLCISTQVGCGMGCVFCATGQMGFRRHLHRGEIVAQVIYFARWLKQIDEQVTNIVIMGMGEPFHNYDETLGAIDRLNDSDGFNFGARRFTISTVGLVPMIHRFALEKRQVNLAISLHAANNELRSKLLPINKKYPIEVLLDACKFYFSETGRRITFEWALIRDVNDSTEEAHKLADLLNGMIAHVNVIPLNPTNKFPGEATTPQRAQEFAAVLNQAGIPCTIRLRRGIDIQAGCGQLATIHDQNPSSQNHG